MVMSELTLDVTSDIVRHVTTISLMYLTMTGAPGSED